MNSSSSESLFQKLAKYADTYKQAKCYWVQVLAKSSFNEKWFGEINGKEYSHSRVYKISGDQFYKLLSGRDNALFELYEVLPRAISDYLSKYESAGVQSNSALQEITNSASLSKRSILDEITFENYGYYLGFDKLE